MKYTLNTDGGARGNPGPAGIGIVIKNSQAETIYEMGAYIGHTTNNEAEYTALLKGLEVALEKNIKELDCFLDSELVVKQLNGQYKVKNANLKTFWTKIKGQALKFEKITFNHTLRNGNKEADQLVNDALDAQHV